MSARALTPPRESVEVTPAGRHGFQVVATYGTCGAMTTRGTEAEARREGERMLADLKARQGMVA